MDDQIVISKIILTRPNKDVVFRPEIPEMSPDEIRSYVHRNFIQSGKILNRSEVLAEDELTLTLTTIHKSNQDRVNYGNNFIIKNIFTSHKAHWIANNIKCEWINEELNGDVIARTWQGFFNNP
jgi:hypothetical protein